MAARFKAHLFEQLLGTPLVLGALLHPRVQPLKTPRQLIAHALELGEIEQARAARARV